MVHKPVVGFSGISGKILLAVTLVINNKDYPERNAGIIDLQQDGRIVR